MATQAHNVDFSYNDNTFTSVKGFWNTIIVTRFENKKKERKKERDVCNTYASWGEHARVATLSNSLTITGFIDDK